MTEVKYDCNLYVVNLSQISTYAYIYQKGVTSGGSQYVAFMQSPLMLNPGDQYLFQWDLVWGVGVGQTIMQPGQKVSFEKSLNITSLPAAFVINGDGKSQPTITSTKDYYNDISVVFPEKQGKYDPPLTIPVTLYNNPVAIAPIASGFNQKWVCHPVFTVVLSETTVGTIVDETTSTGPSDVTFTTSDKTFTATFTDSWEVNSGPPPKKILNAFRKLYQKVEKMKQLLK